MPEAAPPPLTDAPGLSRALARHYPRGLHIEPHSHSWAQVLYAVSGVMWVEAGREALVVPPQRAVWLPPGTTHAIHMMSAVEMRNLYFHERDIGHLSKQCEVFQIDGLLRELIKTIAEREHERDEAWLAAASQLAAMELAHAKRSSLRIPLPDATGTAGGSGVSGTSGTAGAADRRLAMLCRAVIDNPSNEIAFEQHAAQVGASVRTLARLFTRELGMGFAQWRRQVQLAIAVSRLAEGQSVSAAARELGYLPSSFSDMFRRELGVPPSEYGPEETLGHAYGHGGPEPENRT
ncbi:AraC family transcriptional regulator [Paraburkholderia silviterrae]|uniref:AraC family transcriptional regulator n=1 Tax=Paraburkholderia silviterrae TaxID=2528715 RepID=A0A4R5M1B6_9BURK|nr:helix-turn-helix transcriptional regulator [Paraburkholderia silviterrae]TDG19006.1 AraC family transcriptional regulator [Paraburkholderia silviterrae]